MSREGDKSVKACGTVLSAEWTTGAHPLGPSGELRGYMSATSARLMPRETSAHLLPPHTGHGGSKGSNSFAPPGCTFGSHTGALDKLQGRRREGRGAGVVSTVRLPVDEAGPSLH